MQLQSVNPTRSSLKAAVIWPAGLQIAIGAAAMVGTLPGRTIGLGLITEPLLGNLGMSRVQYGLINLWATLLGSLFSLIFGPLVDRIGGRVVLTLNLGLLGATVLRMAHVSTIAELAVMVTLTRGLGQSALSAVSLALVGKRFIARINGAMAAYAALVAVGFVAAIPALQQAIQTLGWRPAWADLGWALIALAAFAWLLVRGTPQALSAAPMHTDAPPSDGPGAPTALPEPSHTLRQALAAPAFWVLAISCSSFNLIFSAVALFSEAILRERGLYTAAVFRAAMGALAASGLLGNAAAAWLLKRIPLARLLALGMLAVTGSILILPLASTDAAVMIYAALLGLAGGVVTVVFFACWPRLFGPRHVGKVQGAAQVLTVLFSAMGPVLLALGQRHRGSYSGTFLLIAPLFACLSALCWTVPMPSKRRGICPPHGLEQPAT